MTQLVNIQELYSLVPETKSLEGVNFTNIRQLLSNVIEKVEKTGQWEFVQYIQGNPSLFIVREKIVGKIADVVNNTWKSISELEIPSSTTKKTKASAKNSQPSREEVEDVPDYEKIEPNNSTLFPKTYLPWSKL